MATIALGPLLLWQGRYVRRRTPRLPEAAGPRTGVHGVGVPLRLLVLGDSSAAGVGVSTQDDALIGQTVAGLSDRYRVDWRLLAETGMTTRGLLGALSSMELGRFDIAVTALGVNDVTRRTPVLEWLEHQERLWNHLRTQTGVSHVVVSGLPPVHLFPALPQPLRWYLGRRATQFDRALIDATGNQHGCSFVSLRTMQEATAIASDGFHPGAPAYADWGDRVARLVTEVGAGSA